MVTTVFYFTTQRLIGGARCTRTAIVVATLFALPAIGCGQADSRVPTHQVQGVIRFRGQPTEGAFIALTPKNAAEGVPNPRATVAKDGTFSIGTFDGNDGAPEGEYIVTMQWYKPVRQGNDMVGGPNVLPVKYASARTSDVKIHVAAGENRLQPIQLR